MAEAIFNDLARERGLPLRAESAGVEAREGVDMAPNTRVVLQEMGFSAGEHRSRRVTREMVEGSGVVLTMSRRQSEYLKGAFGDGGNVLTLPEFAGDTVERDISDPYRLTVHAYRATARRVYDYVERALGRLGKG